MKKLICVVAISVFISSCKKENQADYMVLSGKIENPDTEAVTITGHGFKKALAVNEDGSFSDTLRLETGGYYTLKTKEYATVFLENGHDLDLTLNTKEFDESLNYTGDGAAVNNYLAAKFLLVEKLKGADSVLYALNESDYKNKIGSIRNALDSLLTASGTGSRFEETEKKNIFYAYGTELLKYPSYHAHYAKKEDVKAGEGFYAELDGVDYKDESAYADIPSYRDLASQKFSNEYGENYNEHQSNAKALLATLETFPKGAMKDEIMNRYIGFSLTADEDMETLYNTFMAEVQNEAYKAKVEEKYQKLKKLAKGSPSPVFAYENHKGGTTSLEDLRGKYVYVDVWATWCGPCKAELPFLKQLEKDYHDNNIEFVSISIDTKEAYETWRKMVTEKGLAGIQLIADNDWKSRFVTDYAIDGIPRFILIDPDGNIVNSDAPRPSNEAVRTLFKELKI